MRPLVTDVTSTSCRFPSPGNEYTCTSHHTISFIEADQVSHPQKHKSGSRNLFTNYELVPQSVREIVVNLTD